MDPNADTLPKAPANIFTVLKTQETLPETPNELNVYAHHVQVIRGWECGDCNASSTNLNAQCFQPGIDETNIIHRAIQNQVRSSTLIPARGLDFLENLVVQKPALITARDVNSKIPIIEASSSQIPLLFRIVNLLLPHGIRGSIIDKCNEDHKGCPLLKVAKLRREQCRIVVESSDTPETPRTPKIRHQATFERDTAVISDCIHDEIDVKKLMAEDDKLRMLLTDAFSVGRQAQYSCIHNLLVSGMFDMSQGAHMKDIDGFRGLLSLFPDSVFTELSSRGETALHMAVLLYNCQIIDHELVRQAIEVLIDRYPQSIFTKSRDGQTAYSQLKAIKSNYSFPYGNLVATEELLLRTCIGTEEYTKADGTREKLSQEMKRQYLYRDTTSERQFSFNLTGESIILDKSYINNMENQSGIRFETVLGSVILPYWNPEQQWKSGYIGLSHEAQHPPPNETGTSAIQEEVDPYVNIFEWFWKSKVRKIFTLEVDDRGPEPHSNAAIRRCLRGKNNDRDFEISVFKWKKLDICSDTLSIAAPKAREVWLYCSGNTAVLRSWACCSGLSKLHHLQKLVVNVFPKTSNDEDDCKAYRDEFKKNIQRNCRLLSAEDIHVEVHGYDKVTPDVTGISYDQISQAGPESKPKAEDWVNRLKSFKDFMINFPGQSTEKPSIKVALLDDGVKLAALNGTQIGTSFCPGGPAYFVGSCEHGTEMALCIREICPMAELYIARLDNSREVENQNFTIMSCNQALRWAIDMQVDVISMSWSFRKSDNMQDDQERTFISLVKEAVDKKIILFGSLPDRGPGEKTREFAPVGLDGVIRIGSATPHGESVSENLYANPDFLLPGEFMGTQSSNPHRGSSYATAYASGLAALALYVVKTHHQLARLTDGDHLYKALHKAKTYDGMKMIFSRLSGQQPESKMQRGAFVQPYDIFGQNHTGYEDETQAMAILQNIIYRMIP